MRALSVNQPYATLICAGVKDVENRTWTTKHRGRIYVHASSQVAMAWPDANMLPDAYLDRAREWEGVENISGMPDDLRRYYDLVVWVCRHYHRELDIHDDFAWLRDEMKRYGPALPSRAIVGEVDIMDVVRDSNSDFARPNRYHWLLDNAELYDKPIWPVNGKQRLFELNL